MEIVLQLGFRFEPTPKDAVTYYLPRLIAGEPMHPAIRPFVHAADVYACEPGALAAQFRPTPKTGDRFFFTTCKLQPRKQKGKSIRASRVAGPGTWHSQGHVVDVKDGADGVKIGEVKKLRYKKGGVFTDWLMDEYSMMSQSMVGANKQFVLCKIYVSPRAAPDSVARQESDSFVSAPPVAEQPVVKRPAAAPPVAEQPSTKRVRVAAAAVPIPTPPVAQPPPLPSTPVPTRAAAAQPSIHASTSAPSESCSPMAARDPFCTPAAAQEEEDDDDFDFDFAKTIEGVLEEQAKEEAPSAEADDDDDTDWFGPMMTNVCSEPFDAAMAREHGLMMMPTSACY
ncbi:hypothetical protein PR202_ga04092 [Eleusine coracana subsp. coracana]|uniref:NAC domain-containing protein n=1 Tax=Eleusine coracana subsp. coracana TaxID=191504 RepID=A0AAV5BQR6_ELECO|nr:hypothetical protein PR202_ga04092 [Eleusine coracana subsp. coracana]